MWSVKSEKSNEVFHLLVNKNYTVGRKDTDILILNDPSISRKHATIEVKHLECNLVKPHEPPELLVTDASKLGTEVNNERFKGTSRPVKSGETILFGTQGDSKFLATYEPFVITTSCIAAGAEKRLVKELVLRVGGHQVHEWRKECQLLVMSNLNVTVKVICALVSQKPVVTPRYLEDLIKAYENKSPVPSFDNYLPPLAESQLDPNAVSFKPNIARQTLLSGKIFIFLSSKQFKKLSLVIELAGGVPMLMEEGTDDNDDSILIAPGSCVMSNDAVDATAMTQNAQDWTRHVLKYLKKHGKRMITDPEIGYAILYCSTEKHCNPDADVGSNSGKGPISQSLSQAAPESSEQPEILAHNTEMDTTLNRSKNLSRPDITHVEDTEAVQIKEEPVTPLANRKAKLPQQTVTENESSRKRTRLQGGSDDEPQSKRQVTTPAEIKSEPKSQRQDASGNLTSTTRQHTVRSTLAVAEDAEHQNFDGDDFDSVPTRKSRRKGTVKTTETSEFLKDQGDGMDSLPTGEIRKGVRKETENVKASTSKQRDDVQIRKTDNRSPGTGESNVGDNMEDFDAIPSRRNKRQRETRVENDLGLDSLKREAEIGNDFNDIPSRRSRKQRSEEKPIIKPETEQRVRPEIYAATAQSSSAANNQEDEDKINSTVNSKRVKQEQNTDVPSTSAALPNRSSRPKENYGGFLSAANIDLNAVPLSEFVKEEDMPSGCAVIQEKSLVFRKPGECRRQVTHLSNNTCVWKGKEVKNFKRFKKSSRMDEGLPRIIGGSDLVAHESKRRDDLTALFDEEMQAETQQNEMDRLADEMFEFDSIVSSRKTTATKRRR